MVDGPRLIVDGACYHIMVRGNNKQNIFRAEDDYHKYMDLLTKYKKRYKFRLYGYCFMPNHIHIIGQVIGAGKNLSRFMHGLNMSYALYFNNKYQGVGHVWQGRFKSKVIVKDKYLIDCINYIESNPAAAEIVESPHKYLWSSYRERNLLDSIYSVLDDLSPKGGQVSSQL